MVTFNLKIKNMPDADFQLEHLGNMNNGRLHNAASFVC
jgi:hypothetical protein